MSKTEPKKEEPAPQFDDVLRRMLATPPAPNKKPKPAGKKASSQGPTTT